MTRPVTRCSTRAAAAAFRAVMGRDADDGIEWMNKTDLELLENKATLAKALGEKAYSEGHEEEAVRQYRETIDAGYGKLPRTETTLNETGRWHTAIFIWPREIGRRSTSAWIIFSRRWI